MVQDVTIGLELRHPINIKLGCGFNKRNSPQFILNEEDYNEFWPVSPVLLLATVPYLARCWCSSAPVIEARAARLYSTGDISLLGARNW